MICMFISTKNLVETYYNGGQKPIKVIFDDWRVYLEKYLYESIDKIRSQTYNHDLKTKLEINSVKYMMSTST